MNAQALNYTNVARIPYVPTLKDLTSVDVSEVIQVMERVAQVLLRGCNISIRLFFCKKGVINFL